MDSNKFSESACKERNEQIVRTYTDQGYVFPDEPSNGSLVVGPDVVMRSAAGWYIGCLCLEYSTEEPWTGEWIGPMPYARHTPYMTQAEADSLLARHNNTDPEAVLEILANTGEG